MTGGVRAARMVSRSVSSRCACQESRALPGPHRPATPGAQHPVRGVGEDVVMDNKQPTGAEDLVQCPGPQGDDVAGPGRPAVVPVLARVMVPGVRIQSVASVARNSSGTWIVGGAIRPLNGLRRA